MNKKEFLDFLSEKNQLELTDELIKKLVTENKWKDEKSLKELADMGAKWNTIRNSVVFPPEFF